MFKSIIVAALPLLASATPVPDVDFFSSLVKRADGLEGGSLAKCDVSAIKMNSLGLSGPAPGLVLDHIALGRGTQNYTCADSTADSKPVAAGAVATLFNVTCMAGPYPGLLDVLPGIALKYPFPSQEQILASSAADFLLGSHYFVGNDTTTAPVTPFFNLNTVEHQYGMVGLASLGRNDAKTNPGTNVPNLRLGSKNRDGTRTQEVFRLNSAGGQPPKTCNGLPKTFEVPYATEYWFWSQPDGAPLKTGTYASA